MWCRGWLVTDVWISTASILNLCAISIDRYVAVTRPVKYRSIMTPRRAKTIVACVWILSFLICFPPLLPQWKPAGFEDGDSIGSGWLESSLAANQTLAGKLDEQIKSPAISDYGQPGKVRARRQAASGEVGRTTNKDRYGFALPGGKSDEQGQIDEPIENLMDEASSSMSNGHRFDLSLESGLYARSNRYATTGEFSRF